MGDNKNPNTNYTFANRYQRFISRLTQFAISARSPTQIDNSPDGIFQGEPGDLLTKYNNLIYYRHNGQTEFTSLSDQFPNLTKQTAYVLAQGVNKKASWVKTATGLSSWKLVGYFSPICGVDCAITGSASGSVL